MIRNMSIGKLSNDKTVALAVVAEEGYMVTETRWFSSIDAMV